MLFSGLPNWLMSSQLTTAINNDMQIITCHFIVIMLRKEMQNIIIDASMYYIIRTFQLSNDIRLVLTTNCDVGDAEGSSQTEGSKHGGSLR